MRNWTRAALLTTAMGASLLPAPALAQAPPDEELEVTVADGSAEVQVAACGNTVAVLGRAEGSCDGSQTGQTTGADGSGGTRSVGAVSGSGQALVCGNAVTVAGGASSDCAGAQRSTVERDGRSDGAQVDVLRWALAAQGSACGNGVAVAGEAGTRCGGSQGTDVLGAGGETDPGDAGTQVPTTVLGGGAERGGQLGDLVLTGPTFGWSIAIAALLLVTGGTILSGSRPGRRRLREVRTVERAARRSSGAA